MTIQSRERACGACEGSGGTVPRLTIVDALGDSLVYLGTMRHADGHIFYRFIPACGGNSLIYFREDDVTREFGLDALCAALGWQGGTIYQVLAALRGTDDHSGTR